MSSGEIDSLENQPGTMNIFISASHLISDARPTYYLAKPQPRERAWKRLNITRLTPSAAKAAPHAPKPSPGSAACAKKTAATGVLFRRKCRERAGLTSALGCGSVLDLCLKLQLNCVWALLWSCLSFYFGLRLRVALSRACVLLVRVLFLTCTVWLEPSAVLRSEVLPEHCGYAVVEGAAAGFGLKQAQGTPGIWKRAPAVWIV